MAPRSVLVGPLPPLLSDLVRQLLAGTGEVTLSSANDHEGLVAAAVAAHADVVIASIEPESALSEFSRVLSRQLRHSAVVSIDRRGRTATRYAQGSLVDRSDDLSPSELRRLIGPPSETA